MTTETRQADVTTARDQVHIAAEQWSKQRTGDTVLLLNAALDAYVVTLDASGEPWRRGSR